MKKNEDLRRELYELMKVVFYAFLDNNCEVIQVREGSLIIEDDIGIRVLKSLSDLSCIRNTDTLEDIIAACYKDLDRDYSLGGI